MDTEHAGPLDRIIRFCLENKLVVSLAVIFVIAWGVLVAPFDWELGGLPRDPVPVDAIPDIGENQQVVFTEWMGRSPQDVEDQISYPLTTALLGVPGVKTVRSYSFFGFSSIYVIFKDNVEFYWSRTRVLEKMNSLPAGTLPKGVQPALGPDATALGQIFWYTLEGRDEKGRPTGGWDPQELRSIQDWTVRYALLSAEGVSEVASVGGFVEEYQIDVDPDAMRAAHVTLQQIFMSVKMSNVDVGARTIEVNKAEYIIRGLGFIQNLDDIRQSVVAVHDNIPIRIMDIAKVSRGPALRRGALDKGGAEASGGVVVVRYGFNPLAAIKNVKKKIAEIQPSLPKKTLADGTVSQVTVVPFYDRSGLIYETLGTLNSALIEEILVAVFVVIVLVLHLRSSVLISGLLPLAVLMCFIGMKTFHVDANIVALSGIAIAIGVMVDMGIIICENILKRLEEAPPEQDRLEVVYEAASEVGGAVMTSVVTTVVSFLPVFTMEAAEGKLFKPLAYTKSFALAASLIVALTIIPAAAHVLFTWKTRRGWPRRILLAGVALGGLFLGWKVAWWLGLVIVGFAAYHFVESRLSKRIHMAVPWLANGAAVLVVAIFLTEHWLPLGPEKGGARNFIFVVTLMACLLGFFWIFQKAYPAILRWCLAHKLLFLCLPALIITVGLMIWRGFDRTFFFLPSFVRQTAPAVYMAQKFPGLGKEFMPPLDEGSYLYMPTTMPHASIGESLDVLQKLDMALSAVPEVDLAVGKLGRAETPLDPAPISMFEITVNYKPEYIVDQDGHRLRFKYDPERRDFVRDGAGKLVPDPDGRPFRNWRPHIHSAGDIWKELIKVAQLPGTTSAPKLQPIAARIVMLQSGMRAPMGVKVKGPKLETIEKVGLQIEKFLKEVPSVQAEAVIADRIVGKPYLEIAINRKEIARYGLHIRDVQDVIEVAIGGKRITTTVEGRERYPVRVRYSRELRDRIESLGRILVAGKNGTQIPIAELAEIKYIRGPQVIKSEDTFLIGYVLFDMKAGHAEVEVVEDCQRFLKDKEAEFREAYRKKVAELGRGLTPKEVDALPGLNLRGCSYLFAGSYENQVRSEKKMIIVLPVVLFLIFLILYFQFRVLSTTALVFSGVFVAWSGGFLMIWLYTQPWFLNFDVFGVAMRTLFQVHPMNLSVAVWVGFLVLFGIATEDGVILATYLDQSFARHHPKTIEDVRAATLEAGKRRIRPCLMTVSTTILALIPVLTSTGRGADVMVPMAIPSFGGMTVVLITVFVVPTLYCWLKERGVKPDGRPAPEQPESPAARSNEGVTS